MGYKRKKIEPRGPRDAIPGFENIRHWIKWHRRRLKIRQDELAKKCGVTLQFLCYIENGKMQAGLGSLYLMAKTFGVSMESFMLPVPEEIIKENQNWRRPNSTRTPGYAKFIRHEE